MSFLAFLQTPIVIAMLTIVLIIFVVILIKWLMQGGKYVKNTTANGKVVIITGANSGIGAETALDMAKRGARVYMACRDMAKCERVRQRIISETRNDEVYALKLDLASMNSIREFVIEFKKRETRLDILINNAGIMGCPRMLTKDGFEMQIGVNHMGHFLLTNLLLDWLKKSTPSRIVVVSSLAHVWGKIKKDDLNSEKNYKPQKAYSQSKLANILFTRELAKRLTGTGVTVNALHPGVIATDITRNMGGTFLNCFYNFVFKFPLWPFTKTIKNGAQTTIYAAIEPELTEVTGKYFSDCKLKEVAKHAQDDELAAWLWNISVEWTSLKNSI
ncbi:retinol dehydrogenase 12 isoform X2 [Zeugodacus cucurbitae]|uniref:retinol dehydrogenase 12 isoform X2 n=2 Tax=Zeugodacus cucurbitae TaxID=28588 RepID=UPI0023D943D3|nr:retinol dehydrogenase 12 isoform X2 [Zeugodacus cucurbitae]XP_054089976.1 retinol dehydrogenase 12 isoform X2 [Zeugodacus cucurbitae]XP_054089977.1 retinol dehydrogenase 12 isoform X2 [Zeugodacus cucurbitae]XP_054089978.1 retinol dehydrogenase 12 isoform X2 [Zeugodacus cucurbitae]XP_054089979.1 retinol dehydrogenase 12 isoform X2 [Zeugodacus cucurbitae]